MNWHSFGEQVQPGLVNLVLVVLATVGAVVGARGTAYINQKRTKESVETEMHEIATEQAKVNLLSSKADMVVAATEMQAKSEAATAGLTPMTSEEKKTVASDALDAIARPDASVALKDAAIEASVKRLG